MLQTSAYSWIITGDRVNSIDDGTRVGTIGPAGSSCESPEDFAFAPEGWTIRRFRMFDADGILYYEGRLLITDEEDNGELLFRPMDDFGEPDAGCVTIKYEEDGRWVTL